jgi:two-component system chemotaxis sensor kinase CheA
MKANAKAPRSIARQTLIHMALRISAVVCLVTGLAYAHLRHTLRDETEHGLRAYAEQRLAREREVFDLAAESGRRFKNEYLRRLASAPSLDVRSRFDALVHPWGDGTLRTRKEGFDQKTQVGIFVGPQQKVDDTFRRRVVLAEELIDRNGPLMTARFPDFYMTMPGNVMVIYWPDSPWVMEMPSDFDMRKQPYLQIADKEHNPRGEQAWTDVFYDSVAKVWMMSFATPIHEKGEHIATIEQDFLLDDFLKRTATESLPGAHNVIFRQNGTLIYAPGRTEAILKANGKYTVEDSHDTELGALFASAKDGGTQLQIAEVGESLVAQGHIPGPNWSFLTVYPKSLITSRALMAARVIFGLGVCSLVLELAILYFVLRKSVANPLGQLTEVTERLAAGDLSQRSKLERKDEVGRLGAAFNQMAAAIQARDAELARHADELGIKVEERTRELATRNEDMRLVLDTVEQGFVTIDLQGTMSNERSKIIAQWLGVTESESLVEYISSSDPRVAEWLSMGLEALREALLPRELLLSQLPHRLLAGSIQLELGYVPILGDDENLEKLLVVMTDVTTRRARERLEVEQREVIAIFQRLSHDSAGFVEFFGETTRMIEELGRDAVDHAHAMRIIHTLKGNAAFFGMTTLASVCHTVEEAVREKGQLTESLVRDIEGAWALVTAKVHSLLPVKRDIIEVSQHDYEVLLRQVKTAAPARSLLDTLDAWTLEPAERRLSALGEQAQALARRLGKGELEVELESHGLRLEPERWSTLWAVLVHIVRNAVDHGLELPEERIAQGKPETCTLRFEAGVSEEELLIAIADDGRGIDWNRVSQRAKALRLPHARREDLEEALFIGGLSTKDQVSELSGRGVGMAAVLAEVKKRGGTVRITSTAGKGTRVECRLPLRPPSGEGGPPSEAVRFSGGRAASAAE